MIGRILVAGATGVIGRALCPLLVADGWQVVGTTRKPASARRLESLGVEPVLVDVFDAGALRAVVRRAQPTALMHQLTDLPKVLGPAGLTDALERNARLREAGTRNLVDAARDAGVTTLVAQSIAFAYAPGTPPFEEVDPLNVDADDPMAARSARAVQLLEDLVLGGPFRGVVLRYGRLYGPGTWTSTPPDGCAVHVDAAADAARRALGPGVSGVYNVAEPGGSVSVDGAIRDLGWSPDFRIPR
jgi:nucleoside-diphosphate-sugar epimerase